MGEKCLPDELRTLFLFEALTDEQLEMLCEHGQIQSFEPGPIVRRGRARDLLLRAARRRTGDVQALRRAWTSRPTAPRSAACTAAPGRRTSPARNRSIKASVRVTKPSRFFVLDAEAFATFMQTQFPMAVHLLEGHMVGGRRQSQIIGQREKLLALGTITAGLTHQLNNPAAATARAVADLRENGGKMRHKLAMLADGQVQPRSATRHWSPSRTRSPNKWQSPRTQELTALETVRPRRRRSATGSKTTGSPAPGTMRRRSSRPVWTPTGWNGSRRRSTTSTRSSSLQSAIGWLKYTIDTELLMNEIAEASKRISALLAGAKQYSQMDRAPYQSADVHELLHSTLMMFGDKIGKDGPVKVVKDLDKSLPELLCYPGDLNQVWTNIIDNAIQAMDGHGTLTLRTQRENEEMIRVEICDDGPGIPDDIVDRIFTPFFTTKPFGEGTGLGLDLAWRIVVEKHHGNLRVQSKPGDTRFIVLLPLAGAGPRAAAERRTDGLPAATGIAATAAGVDRTMTDAKPDLGRFGSFGRGVTPEQAKDIEALGYGAVWVGGSPPAELDWVEPILEKTTTLQVATGIVNIWTADAGPVAESFHRIEKAYPGRFLLGIGVGHPEADARVPQAHRRAQRTTSTSSTSTACRRTAAWSPRWARRCSSCPRDRSRGRASVSDDARAHRPGARAHRPRRVHRARAQGGADHRRREGPRGRPQGARDLPEPDELPQQLEAAGLHR